MYILKLNCYTGIYTVVQYTRQETLSPYLGYGRVQVFSSACLQTARSGCNGVAPLASF